MEKTDHEHRTRGVLAIEDLIARVDFLEQKVIEMDEVLRFFKAVITEPGK